MRNKINPIQIQNFPENRNIWRSWQIAARILAIQSIWTCAHSQISYMEISSLYQVSDSLKFTISQHTQWCVNIMRLINDML